MGETWDKLRSMVRGAFVATTEPATPSASSTPTASAPRMEPASPSPARPSPPIFREVTPADPANDLVRSVELKTEMIRGRLDALESRVREQADRPAVTPTTQVDLTAVTAEIASLREMVSELAKQHASVRALAEELARHVADLGTAMTTTDQRVTETTRDVRDAQASADQALEGLYVTRSELQTWTTLRGRDVGQRIAPLYVLSLIALLAALGAAVMAAIGMM